MKNHRAVIWDLDGTLIDSQGAHFNAWARVTAEYGIPFDQEIFIDTFGMHNHAVLSLWLGEHWTPEREAEISEKKEAYFREEAREHVKLFPRAAEWLEALKHAGWRQGLGSSAPWPNIHQALDVLGLYAYLEVVLSGDDFPSKPDPTLFLSVARGLDIEPARCVVVEDAPSGVEGAHRARMRAIAVTTTHDADALKAADIVSPSLAALPPDVFDRLIS